MKSSGSTRSSYKEMAFLLFKVSKLDNIYFQNSYMSSNTVWLYQEGCDGLDVQYELQKEEMLKKFWIETSKR